MLFVMFALSLCFGTPRARDLGIPFSGVTGFHNAITDVPGVLVGHRTIVKGKGAKGELTTARTGVTVIFPAGKKSMEGVPAAWGTLNGNGEMTGVSWIDEAGVVEGPIALTNTQSVGLVRDTIARWVHEHYPGSEMGTLPVVAETDDSWLNDLYGHHVRHRDVLIAIESAKSGLVEEGAVGAGTGTVAFGFKAGIGTSSRKIGQYVLGALAQVNFGKRTDLQIRGRLVGKELAKVKVGIENPLPRRDGSIIVVVATDAPLLPHQLKRLVKRIPLGIGLTGGLGRNTSGDLFIVFSTARPVRQPSGLLVWNSFANEDMDVLFEAVVQTTEESILNSLVAAKNSTGINGNRFFAIPHDRLEQMLKLLSGNPTQPQTDAKLIQSPKT